MAERVAKIKNHDPSKSERSSKRSDEQQALVNFIKELDAHRSEKELAMILKSDRSSSQGDIA